MGGDAGLLELAKDFGWHLHALFNAINHDRDGVQVVFDRSTGAILRVGNIVSNVGHSRVFKCE